jgi:AraC family transcriptional regulator, transcriptional activator of pobA
MKPLVTNITKIKDCLKSLGIEIFDYLDHDDFSIIRVEDLGLKLPFQSHTFRPDFFALTIIKSANCYFHVGSASYHLTSNWVLLTKPEVFISSKWLYLDKAYHITFNTTFLKKYCHVHINKLSIPVNLNGIAFPLMPQQMSKIENTCLGLYNEAITQSVVKHEVIGNMLMGLLLELQQFKENRIGRFTSLSNDKENDFTNTFVFNLERNFNDLAFGKTSRMYRTADYATLQHVSKNHLSKAISYYTGKTINCWIKDKAIDDIMYLLKHSDKSLKEISSMYGFHDLSYFYSYVKKHIGISPHHFRKIRRIYQLDGWQ